MVVDGKKIAEEMLQEVKEKVEGKNITLSVFVVGNNPATESFIRIKKRKAEEAGIVLNEIRFESDVLEEKLLCAIEEEGKKNVPIVVQLPLPPHINKEKVLNTIPTHLDVDVLSDESNEAFDLLTLKILPPVVGAIKEILERENIDIRQKKVLVVGLGALVGKPSLSWFKNHVGAEVKVADSKVKDLKALTLEADIIVSGVGTPDLITPDMVREGAILLDAGTSEEGGELKGDVSKECEKKAKIFTPVPGGIGPMTVSILLRNVVDVSG